MTASKFILKSKTIWGLIISVLPQLADALGYPLSADAVAEADTLFQLAMQHVDGLITVAGAALALYGRLTASESLTAVPSGSGGGTAASLALLVALSGCAGAQNVVTKAGDTAERAADIYRDATLRQVKGVTLGAWSRETSDTDACGMALIAGFYDRLKSCKFSSDIEIEEETANP